MKKNEMICHGPRNRLKRQTGPITGPQSHRRFAERAFASSSETCRLHRRVATRPAQRRAAVRRPVDPTQAGTAATHVCKVIIAVLFFPRRCPSRPPPPLHQRPLPPAG